MFIGQADPLEDEKWKSAYALFERAMDIPAGERLAFSRQATEDPEVLRLVLELLDSEHGSEETTPSSAAAPHPGKDYGRFAITELLGRGGMGEVYSAQDTELNRAVAMKFLSAQNLGGSVLVDRLIREARAASALNHPGIVTVYEVIRSEDSLAIVMERVDGIALRKLCGRPNPPAQVLGWGQQVAEALAAAHGAGVVHRDIKPENLMIRPDGYVKVLDFGVAQTGDEPEGIPIGTLGYMSPEQIDGKPLTGASDVFALGVVLTELVSGRHPFLAETADLTREAIKTSEPERLTAGASKIGEPLGSLLRSMLAREPELRPSAATVATRLAAITREPATSPWRRWSVPAIVGLAASVVIGTWLSADKGTLARAPHIVPFTAYEGIERNPSFSPNGDRVAFCWNGPDGKNWDIYVKAVGEEVPHRLTTDLAEDFNPVWSPDGRQIAFLRKTADVEAPVIVIVPANGGPERELTRTQRFINKLSHPIAWWPDGKSLVFRKPPGRERLGLHRIFLDTGKEEPLTYTDPGNKYTQSEPLPIDENRLALVRYAGGGKWALCLAVRGKDPQCLNPGESINGMVLEPDDKSLLYATESAIWRVALRGDRLGSTTRVRDGSFPELTGDRRGRRLAFTKTYFDLNVWSISPGSDNFRKLIASSAEDTNPDYSPDGEKILFISTRSGHAELYSCDRDGSHTRRLTSLGGEVQSANWSPDGKWIAFEATTNRTQYANIYILPAGGGPARRITSDQGAMSPAWSLDGRWIYYSLGRASFWKIPVDGGTPVMISDSGFKIDPRLSGDGQSVYYMRMVMNGGVRRLDLQSATDTVIPGTERAVFGDWALGRDGIYFVEDAAVPALDFLESKTLRVSRLASLPGKRPMEPANFTWKRHGLAVSPDGSSFLYTSLDTELGDIMLIEGLL